MEFSNISQNFTEDEKRESFLQIQNFILESQGSNKPFFIGRLGGNESNFTGGRLAGSYRASDALKRSMLHGAGIQFHDSADESRYATLYRDCALNCDILGVWGGEMYKQLQWLFPSLLKADPNLNAVCAQGLEPYYFFDDPQYKFNQIFNNKKVLVFTSHPHTALRQIPKHSVIFSKGDIFKNNTQFHIYQPPQQHAGSHDEQSWHVHYDNATAQLKKIINNSFDFDIALVASGGLGMPLSNYIYSHLGRSAFCVGGALQLFFGIMGRRWHEHPQIKPLINSHWAWPLEQDVPAGAFSCEGGCYW